MSAAGKFLKQSNRDPSEIQIFNFLSKQLVTNSKYAKHNRTRVFEIHSVCRIQRLLSVQTPWRQPVNTIRLKSVIKFGIPSATKTWMLRPFVKRVVDRRDKVADNVYAEVVDIYEGCLVQNCVRGKQILAEKSAESFRLLGPWSRR